MNIERLELIATMLREVIAGQWKNNASEYKELTVWLPTWFSTHENSEGEFCGYAACVIGHAMLDNRFNALGFTSTDYHTPQYQSYSGWRAVAAFLEVPDSTAYYLFSSEEYDLTRAGAADVLERLEYLLANQ